MTVQLSGEQERMLADMVAAGLAKTADEALDKAVRALHDCAVAPSPETLRAQNLSELLLGSPLAGADLDFGRSQDFAHDLAVVTRNVRDFAAAGVATVNPWAGSR